MNFDISQIIFDDQGLVPLIVQDAETSEVLMLGYCNKETLEETVSLGLVVFYSRSRKQRWLKGESSGNLLHLRDLKVDCDRDAVLAKVQPHGPTCHTGNKSCFGSEV